MRVLGMGLVWVDVSMIASGFVEAMREAFFVNRYQPFTVSV